MRILHVVRRLDAAWGGAPAAAAHMASALAVEGHTITIATTVSEDGSTLETEQLATVLDATIRVECFPRTGQPYDYSPQLGRWLGRNVRSFDLVEVHGVFEYPSWSAAERARRSGRPYIVHPHGSLDPFDLRKHQQLKEVIGRLAIRRVLAHAAAVVVTTSREGSALHTFGARPPTVPIPLPYLSAAYLGDAERFRRNYKIPDGPILLFLGRVDYKKGLQHLLDAADLLLKAGVQISMVVGGDRSSRYASGLQEQIGGRGLDTAFRLVGHLNETDKADALAAASIFALVSDNENYGLVLVEAARAGLPMLLSDQVYLEHDLAAGGGALVVERNGAAVADALEDLLQDGRALQEMSQAVRRTAGELFDWRAAARAHSAFRETLVPQEDKIH